MKNQMELIAYYTKNAESVIASYGVGDEGSIYAMHLLQAVSAGMPHKDIFDYAEAETARIKVMTMGLDIYN